MVRQNLFVGAKPLLARFVQEHFPDEERYFDVLWAALGDRLVSLGSCEAGNAGHPVQLGGLSFVGDEAVPVQKSLEVIRILAGAIPAFGRAHPEAEMVRNYVIDKAQILRSEAPVLDALAKLVVEILGSGEPVAARIRIDFLPRGVMVRDPRTGQTTQQGHSSPWRLLEYLCCRMGKEVHWACGLVIFPEWQKADGRPGRQSFSEHRSRLNALLKDLSPDRWPLAELQYGAGPYTRLESCRFESNVFDVKAVSHEATVLFYDGKFMEAANKAQKAIGIWEASQEAFETLLACLTVLDFGKLPEEFLKHVLRQVRSRVTVLRGALACAERLDEDTLGAIGELLGSWSTEMAQIVRAEKQLTDWLKVETDMPSEYTPAHALIDKIERLRATSDKRLGTRLWQEIVESGVYRNAKRRSLAMLWRRNSDAYKRNEEDLSQDHDALFYEHVMEGGGVAAVDPRKLENFIASVMTHKVMEQWAYVEHNVNPSEQRELRRLKKARMRLLCVEQARPSAEDLANAMGCQASRVRQLQDLERLCDPVDQDVEDSSDTENA